MTLKNIQYGAVILLFFAFVYLLGASATRVGASSFPGGQAAVSSTTAASLTTTAGVLIATTTGCAARIISTQGEPIMLTFSDRTGQTPTALFGHVQAASTTVTYDGGLYGCGLIKAYSFGTATTTITETR